MIHADIHGKAHIPEDMLTSNCMGLLSLLPDNQFIDFFSEATSLDGKRLNLSAYDQVKKVDFWPWLQNGGEPDLIVSLCQSANDQDLAMVIEAKHGASKSNVCLFNGQLQETEIQAHRTNDCSREQYHPSDQLARYLKAAQECYSNAVLVFLTHHRSMPTAELSESLQEAGDSAPLYWLSWFHLYNWLTKRLRLANNSLSMPEKTILKTLRYYLDAKGYRCFHSWPQYISVSLPNVNYCHAYFSVCFGRN
ncbi:MAG TPA: hypothetical protein PLG17_00395, partial [Thermodesulfobacteriota bacterium]|nr:hypothetical protein [Thermodesulfobacteriota bacterium]